MKIDFSDIPRHPSTGLVIGRYFVRHVKVPGYSGVMGTVMFENGRSVKPLEHVMLARMVSNLARDVELEPADDETRAALAAVGLGPAVQVAAPVEPEPAIEPTPEFALTVTEPSPEPVVVEPEPETVDASIDAVESIDALRSIAMAEGVEVNEQWGEKRLRKEIRKARGE